MKRNTICIILLISSLSLIAIDLTEMTRLHYLHVSWGDANNQIYMNDIGQRLIPTVFGIDRQGNIYIDDTKGHSRILVFRKTGELVRVIDNSKTMLDGITRMDFSQRNELIISDSIKVLEISEDGKNTILKKLENWANEPSLRNFFIIDDDIVYKNKGGGFVNLMESSNNLQKKNVDQKWKAFSEKMNLAREIDSRETNNIYLSSSGKFISDQINDMQDFQTKLRELKYRETNIERSSSFVPYEHDESNLRYLSMDKDGNTYWFYGRNNKPFYIYVYDPEGSVLIKFKIEKDGDITLMPYVDIHGNIYAAQIDLVNGIDIFKYERRW